MRNVATVQLIGSTIKNTLRHTANGFPVLDVTVAGNAPSADGEKTKAYYQQVQVLGKYAETLAQVLVNGMAVAVLGQLSFQSWEKDGKRNSAVRITADSFVILDGEHETIADAKGQERLMNGQNRATLLGNLTRDAELRYTPNGHAVARFSVAVNRRRGDQEEVGFYDVTAWNELAEQVGSLKKGMPVLVEAAISNDNWTDKEGNKRYATRFDAATVQTLRRPAGAERDEDTVETAKTQNVPAPEPSFDDLGPAEELPF